MIEWELLLDDIVVERLHREDLGDLTDLGVSIAQAGLVRPVAITPGGVLVSGHRRLAAAREIGMTHIAVVTVRDLLEATEVLAGDLKEEEGQLAMSYKARASLGKMLETLPKTKGTSARQLIAKALGMSEHSWQRLRIVAEAIENGELEPEVFEQMDAEDSPTPAWKALTFKREGKEEAPKKPKQFDMSSEHNLKLAAGAKARFSKALGGLDGYRQGLEGLELHKVLAVASDQELEDWRRILAKTTNTLKKVRSELQREENQ